MNDDPVPTSVEAARKTWRIRMILVFLASCAAIALTQWSKWSHDQTFVIGAFVLLLVIFFFLPAFSRSRADRDPAFARGYWAAEWFLGLPGFRLQASLLLLAAVLLMIPIMKALAWLGAVQAIRHIAGPLTLAEWLLLVFAISLAIVTGAFLLYRVLTRNGARKDIT